MATIRSTKRARFKLKSQKDKVFCEFFAGIGLVRAGLEKTGWRCIYANDIDPKKKELYSAKFDDEEHFHLGDIWNTDAVADRIDEQPFLATASFPCIDLSLAGHCRGLNGSHSSTFFAFAKVLETLRDRKPKLVMIENVTGLITSHGGKDFASICRILAENGYWLDAFVLDAKYFVPQSRPRIFIIGLHKNYSIPSVIQSNKGFTLDDPWRRTIERGGQVRPAKLLNLMESIDLPTGWMATPIQLPHKQSKPLSTLIDFEDSEEWWDRSQVKKHYDSMSDLHKTTVDDLRKEGGLHVGTIYRRKRNGKTRAEVRFDGVAGCLRTPRGGSARQIVIVIDNGNMKIRWMNPREYARLQGAGDYPLVGKKNQQLFGFGDAVCVPVISWIDKTVLTPIFDAVMES